MLANSLSTSAEDIEVELKLLRCSWYVEDEATL